jgi:hypothetical protein
MVCGQMKDNTDPFYGPFGHPRITKVVLEELQAPFP